MEVGDGRRCAFDMVGDGVILARFYDVNEMMGYLAAKIGGRLGGPNVHAAVYFHRIEANDLAIEAPGKLSPQSPLTRPGTADDECDS